MANTEITQDEVAKKPSKMPLIIGVILAFLGGGGGFYIVYSGTVSLPESHTVEPVTGFDALPKVGFVALDPMVVTLGPASGNRHLRFTSQLEVDEVHQADVEMLKPRVIDVLNSYLRALEARDLEDPSALTRLRAQMLRRIQLVTGEGRVKDLLIMEFVLN